MKSILLHAVIEHQKMFKYAGFIFLGVFFLSMLTGCVVPPGPAHA